MSRQRLRVPAEDGAIVAEPSLAEAGEILADNTRRLEAVDCDILGRPLAELRGGAQADAVARAYVYLQQAGEPVAAIPDQGPLILAGHQPELFHPGVWAKNFALAGLARRHQAIPFNLVVDNDIVKPTMLHLPDQTAGRWHLASLPFDNWAAEVPYEERTVRDEALFASLPQRADQLTRSWNFMPMLPGFWEEVSRQAKRTPMLGERLASARRTLERQWGCHNFELPLSALCQIEVFAWFACHILVNLPGFQDIYNRAVADYRRRAGIRDRNHPVPDLVQDGSWREAPFWAWQAGQQRRRRLFARPVKGRLELRAGEEAWPSLPVRGRWEDTIASWQDLQAQGFKIRSRALTTTLFARLFLGDLFIHGIGGGKYDELTDAICKRFYQFEPPAYLVLSATLLLPLPAFPIRAAEREGLARELRDLHYNPQRHLRTGVSPALVAEKEACIASHPGTRAQRRERFQAIRTLNEQLRPFVAEQAYLAFKDLHAADRQLQANAVMTRRDYPFCLFPETKLRPFCQQFLQI